MAVTSIKTTYSLDVETVEKLEELARRWNVSKSAALRRAIRAATKIAPPPGEDAVRALEELQQSLDMSKDLARQWEKRTRDERRASSRHLESK
jgi:predicted transcriptional regulator